MSVQAHSMTTDELIKGLLRGNCHRGGIRCLQLMQIEPQQFAQLQAEVAELQRIRPSSHVSRQQHVTHWTGASGDVRQYSLLNRSGDTQDFSSDHDLSCRGKWFFDGQYFPVLDRFIAAFPHLINFRINQLHSGAGLPAHEEHVPFRTLQKAVGARLRFHLPISTNDGAELNLDGQVYRLQPGFVYLINQGCVHAACNHGPAARSHLVWDGLLTQALFAFLFGESELPDFLRRLPDTVVTPIRYEAPGPYRSLAPAVSNTEADTLSICEPQ